VGQAPLPEASFSLEEGGWRRTWAVRRLWVLANDLQPFDYAISNFSGFDLDCWYGTVHRPTLRSILEHFRRIEAADLRHPIILNQAGQVMDGIHRICKAHLAGQHSLRAVQFIEDPPPDRVRPLEDFEIGGSG
jgi:hypothetical protein